ncbi:Putative D-alanyl-D-alanine carboxypeptidase [Paenibacillus solanacearum]|uniref:D-alanyl-D-alanine carboxypeptidase n=1 Tax=Paenibacillus solanacearum TaxID=2048548 RepID=A0A916NPB7_9BACL|nr:serine hydrolase domain-containing protein [Paenibacillus solanacearum]CAG7618755.1 Putative D-alanyl-D-alanine carboxypeptidase [Paenibacillus solanacearum]
MYRFDVMVDEWVHEHKIPGGVLSVTVANRLQFQKAYGSYSDGLVNVPIGLDTIFDLASLTKVVSTLPAMLVLVAQGKLKLDDPVSTYIAEFAHPDITVKHLLMHTSGLRADLPYKNRAAQGRNVLSEVLQQESVAPPGTEVTYSDLGMILAGEIIARVSGEPLDRFVRRTVFEPLGMTGVGFNPDASLKPRIAATELVDGVYVHGKVHDEKCLHLGGVSGSAGLFGTAEDLARYAQFWLHPEKAAILPPELLRTCVQQPFRSRGIGWEVLHDENSVPASCGATWSKGSFGHTGFTGTSLWIDPVRELSVVFLTNAVHFGRNNPVRHLRRTLHDEIAAALFPIKDEAQSP